MDLQFSGPWLTHISERTLRSQKPLSDLGIVVVIFVRFNFRLGKNHREQLDKAL